MEKIPDKIKALNEVREPGCLAVLQDRKYFFTGNMCIKRTLRRHEWFTIDNVLYNSPPTTIPQRWKNDVAIITYLRERTNIPLPELPCVYEDDGAFYHCTKYVDGIQMSKLTPEDQTIVMQELRQHVAVLKTLKSDTPGVPPFPTLPIPRFGPYEEDTAQRIERHTLETKLAGSLLVPPPNVVNTASMRNFCFRPRKNVRGNFVLCHNDLRPHNVLVDPKTLKIKAIIDWEFAGFLPEWFELKMGETKDPNSEYAKRCRKWFSENCHEVPMQDLPTMEEKLGVKYVAPLDKRER
ncbi:Protein kinase-like domain protein [Niveomyces insectorum RCEF 264]|uniref:Protein kinase-like domain protein n=1 Tax=Niveomyces insectorum RCEF 264 TaxID=1081102 RepID=A0A167XB65_9HYPO|nr:Protein kinase-like domain protein [Niveomyces insectorum RCEF 264]